ncbi:MAG TPA: MarR family transcriptional regulator, partial [Eubacteriaceae bacterium]|nr:MarR family transcriptional regulator [Eubacteriaceae bacterium]
MENETFELEQCVAYIATNASKQLAENFDHLLRKQGISRVQWIALYYIGKEKTLSQAGLAQHMRIKPSTVTTLIDRMIRDGLIMRTKDPGNRRKVCISLTKEGEVHR